MNAEQERVARAAGSQLTGGISAAQQKSADAEAQRQQMEEMMTQKKEMVRALLDPSAIERMNRIGLVKPQRQAELEDFIIRMAQAGKIRQRIDDAQLVDLLGKLGDASSGPARGSAKPADGKPAAAGAVNIRRRRGVDSDDEDLLKDIE